MNRTTRIEFTGIRMFDPGAAAFEPMSHEVTDAVRAALLPRPKTSEDFREAFPRFLQLVDELRHDRELSEADADDLLKAYLAKCFEARISEVVSHALGESWLRADPPVNGSRSTYSGAGLQ